MAKSKHQKQSEALDRLTARIAEDMGSGRKITFSQRQEYNRLKQSLGIEGKLI